VRHERLEVCKGIPSGKKISLAILVIIRKNVLPPLNFAIFSNLVYFLTTFSNTLAML
jgi:hypothetical protein